MKFKFIFAWYDFWVGLYWDREKRMLYFFPIPMFGVKITIHGRRCYVLVKRALFYGPDYRGYTGIIERAGRYTLAEATSQECKGEDAVTKHHISEFL